MPEPGPIRRYEVAPYVEFRMFQLSDTINVGAPLAEFDRSGDDLVIGGASGVLFRSAGNNFYPRVRLELWASEPPADPGTWDRIQESDFDSQDGTVQFMSVMAAFAGDEIHLPHPGTYEVRAYCRGREQAAALPARSVDHRGAEEWLVQIWPTRPSDAAETA
ncbi:hypothetical protein [Micromonospora sp. URMC 103]|uniref:hypothetical protein n=1 Tax=Micromonospora sp. URMC 103 TaxID=3423406 RepID=UPI003F1A6879